MQATQKESISALLGRCAEAPSSAGEWWALAESLTPRLRGAVIAALSRYRMSRRADLVEELVQEVWCRLFAAERRALCSYRGETESEATAYLRRIAASVVLDRLRGDAASKRIPARALDRDPDTSAVARLADRRGCPERRLLAREQLRGLAGVCGELVRGHRRAERLAIARLALIEGWSSLEIVARLGTPWSVGRVNSFLFRLRRRLLARDVRLPVRARGLSA